MNEIHPSTPHDVAPDSSAEHAIRLEKVEQLKTAGESPWPANKDVNATTKDVLQEYKEGVESRVYMIAGRLMTVREHGKTAFCVIHDRTGRIQVYVKKDLVGDAAFNTLQHTLNVGDIVWFTGPSFKTKTGEITIHATGLALLSKCLYPLPEKFHGLTDIETVYRQRYLDLISNAESKERFKKRSLVVRAIRSFLDSYDFLEVETPMLHPIPGGAAARPFVTHHNALHTDLYLRIAPELYLKRLVIGGFERVYEINRNFRNEGISTRHNPEFTMLEFYMAYQDYNFAMDLVEKMIRDIAQHVCGTLELPFGNRTIDFSKPFVRMSMQEAVMHYGNYTKVQVTGDAINDVLKKEGITLANSKASWGEKLAALFEHCAEKKLEAPTFITQFPVEISPLAKRDPNNPELAARFELFIAGMEISNGFNELNDPFDQAARFKEQVHAREAGDTEAHHYDAEYVHALEYGLPPTVGVGIGIDRLVMLLTNTTSIKDVILFPTLKKKD
ncbi:MAG: lysine--tRNA ligase [Candidatus Babeliales bacterium]